MLRRDDCSEIIVIVFGRPKSNVRLFSMRASLCAWERADVSQQKREEEEELGSSVLPHSFTPLPHHRHHRVHVPVLLCTSEATLLCVCRRCTLFYFTRMGRRKPHSCTHTRGVYALGQEEEAEE